MYTKLYCINDIDSREFNFNADYRHCFGESKIIDIITNINNNNSEMCKAINDLCGQRISLLAETDGNIVSVYNKAELMLSDATVYHIKSYINGLSATDFKNHGRRIIQRIIHPTESYICYRDDDGEVVITSLYDFIFNGIYKEFDNKLEVKKIFHIKTY